MSSPNGKQMLLRSNSMPPSPKRESSPDSFSKRSQEEQEAADHKMAQAVILERPAKAGARDASPAYADMNTEWYKKMSKSTILESPSQDSAKDSSSPAYGYMDTEWYEKMSTGTYFDRPVTASPEASIVPSSRKAVTSLHTPYETTVSTLPSSHEPSTANTSLRTPYATTVSTLPTSPETDSPLVRKVGPAPRRPATSPVASFEKLEKRVVKTPSEIASEEAVRPKGWKGMVKKGWKAVKGKAEEMKKKNDGL